MMKFNGSLKLDDIAKTDKIAIEIIEENKEKYNKYLEKKLKEINKKKIWNILDKETEDFGQIF